MRHVAKQGNAVNALTGLLAGGALIRVHIYAIIVVPFRTMDVISQACCRYFSRSETVHSQLHADFIRRLRLVYEFVGRSVNMVTSAHRPPTLMPEVVLGLKKMDGDDIETFRLQCYTALRIVHRLSIGPDHEVTADEAECAYPLLYGFMTPLGPEFNSREVTCRGGGQCPLQGFRSLHGWNSTSL